MIVKPLSPLFTARRLTGWLVVSCILIASARAQDDAAQGQDSAAAKLNSLVNPFVSTGGNRYVCGHNSPGATVPFGLVRLSPDTISSGGATAVNTSGYYYPDLKTIGFSHTRLCGTGAVDGGNFRVTPVASSGTLAEQREWRLTFSHDSEIASPGYYSVVLPEAGVQAEMTATSRVGMHRYTFESGAEPKLLIDIGSTLGRGRSEACEVHLDVAKREISGMAHTFGTFSGRSGGIKVYFVARFQTPWSKVETWSGDEVSNVEQQDVAGQEVGVACTFSKSDDQSQIELAVAISHVSIDNARENLDVEVGQRSFDQVRQAAAEQWETILSSALVEGGQENDRNIFYTALYHSFMMPTVFSDVNGEYTGFDKQVHTADGFQYYTDMSLWDTFRTTHPLFTLLVPDRHSDMLQSLVKMAEQGGNLPRWPSGTGYSGSMFGAPAEIAIADAYLKGIRDFDIDTAYTVMRKAALEPAPPGVKYSKRDSLAEYLKYKYCPSDTMSEAVAKTLEYTSTDAAIGQLAAALGHAEDAELFAKRAQYYRNLWNPETQYFQPRDTNGKFSTPLKPLLLTYVDVGREFTDDYVEGSALQWRWAVSHDADGLVSLFDSKQQFADELDKFFAGSSPKVGDLPNGYYWQGNQPDIHAAYLFNAADRPDLTQKWVRWILKHKHDYSPVGLDGNDDGGTLSAWYVLSSLGFYPVVGTDRYELGSPLWQRAVLKLGDKNLEIVAENYAPDRVYVKRVELNGKPLNGWSITHGDIADGGTLRFFMSDTP